MISIKPIITDCELLKVLLVKLLESLIDKTFCYLISVIIRANLHDQKQIINYNFFGTLCLVVGSLPILETIKIVSKIVALVNLRLKTN